MTIEELTENSVAPLCNKAQERIAQAANILSDAAFASGKGGNYERDKVLASIANTLRDISLTLISLPRMKG